MKFVLIALTFFCVTKTLGQWPKHSRALVEETALQYSVDGLQDPSGAFWAQFSNNEVFGVFSLSKSVQVPDFGNLVADWLIPTADSANVSEECLQDSNAYRDALVNLEGWALKMYDASGKMPDGMASLNIHALGHFDQCLRIKHEEIRGKYCTVFLQHRNATALVQNSKDQQNLQGMFGLLRILTLFGREVDPIVKDANDVYVPVTPSIAFCLPASCSAEDIGLAVANKIGRRTIGDRQIVVAIDENYCYSADSKEKELDAAAITVIVILSIVALFLLSGTIYDVWQRCSAVRGPESNGLTKEILLSFSILRNGEKILDTRQNSESLPCLHGIRFISMTWVVLGHVWMYQTFYVNANLPQVAKDTTTWSMQVISNATPSVDTFFLLSGLLVAYVTLKEFDRNNGRFNPLMMYLHRYLRLTPVYALILAFLATLAIYVSTGPFWQSVRVNMDQECRANWWHHLLYINTFYPNDLYCMGETWYLANDMQMFLLAPFFVYALWKWPRAGLLILGAGVAFFLTVGMCIIGIENLPPTILFLRYDTNPNYNFDYYFQSWNRIPPYLVGIFLGYVLHRTKGHKVTLKPVQVVSGWGAAIVGGVGVIYGIHDYGDPSITSSIPLAFSIIYGGLHRTVFVVCVAWVIFACINGYGGWVNTLLSWKAFVPLSRLTYCTYLIHCNWITIYYGSIKATPYYTKLDQSIAYVGHLVFCLGVAFCVSTCIEAPSLNLEKLLFRQKKREDLVRIK